jgi:hypothetical protein
MGPAVGSPFALARAWLLLEAYGRGARYETRDESFDGILTLTQV